MHRLYTDGIQVEGGGSATQRVLDELRRAILSFELRPGAPLGEGDLAARLAVSRTPVREALSVLQQEGLVQRLPNRGALVSEVSLHSVLEAYEVRGHLEAAAARSACHAITDADIAAMRAAIEQIHPQPQDLPEMLENEECDQQLHGTILRVCGNALLRELVEQTRRRTQRVMFVLPPGRYGTLIEEHAAIVDALALRDPDAAEEAMRRHLRSAAERLYPLWPGRP